ncbi:MAG TPA: GAF and ANTAR domain-containing protein [Nocardioidaceae bacterium]|jgi:GAF domain-containing protein|nr:GAF and ANTAR domain-containing protein [Nocardioidaceae bacterium]
MVVPASRLAEVFVEVADTLVDTFDVFEFLGLVTLRTAELVQSEAAGLCLADGDGRLQFMAASNETTELLELFQVQTDEGPCQDCFHSGTAVVNADLTQAGDRWPRFAPRAVESGYRSVHAIPLRLRQSTVGALNLFNGDAGRLEPEEVDVVQALADVATIGLLQERALRRAEVLSEQLQSALDSRVVIEQAKGAVAQLHSVSIDEAFQLMRGYARRNRTRLLEVAQAVVDDPTRLPSLRPG